MPSLPQFSCELSFLVRSLSQKSERIHCEHLRQHISQSGSIDWNALLGLADRHRVVPHLFLALKNSASDLVPTEFFDALRRRFQANSLQNARFMSELVRVIRALEQAGIPAMPFKGPMLAIQLYGALECRQFRDLDLVVPEEQAIRATKIIRELGFDGPGTLLSDLSPHHQRRTLTRYKDVSCYKTNGPLRIALEVHWRLSNGVRLPGVGEVNANTQIVTNQGTFRALPVPELTLLLAGHGANHAWFRLSWLADLLSAIEKVSSAEWGALYQRSIEVECSRQFVLGLFVLSRLNLLTEPLPNPIQKAGERIVGLEWMLDHVFRSIAAPREWSQHPFHNYPWICRLEGWRAGLRELAVTCSPQPEDAFGRGFLNAHWHRWSRVLQKYFLPATSAAAN